MIDLQLTDDHEALVQTVREFAQKEVAPYIKEWDEKQEAHREIFDKMAELNLLGVCLPEQYGGAGFDYISLGLVCEELEAVDTFLRVAMSVHTGLNSLTLLSWGTEDQKQRYLVPQAKGEKLSTYGLTEPGAGSDVVGARATARREGDEYVLNGEKMWISLADTADNFLFFCWTDEEKQRHRDHSGMSCFIVERGMKGFTSGTIHGKLGIRAGNTGYFSLQDVSVPKENLIGEEGEGFKIAMFALEQGRFTVAAGATGVIRAARDASVAYANERETFGTKIANHQLVKQKIAEMEADYEMCRLLWLRAGWLKNQGESNGRATSLAKWQATVRSDKAAVIYEGTRDIHTLMQADWALGLKKEKPARKILPAWKAPESRGAVAL